MSYGTGTVTLEIPGDKFIIGSNAVRVETKDSRNVTGFQEIVVTKKDTAPIKVSGYLSGNYMKFTLGDAENDPIRYRVLLNKELLQDWTSYSPAPVTAGFSIDKSKILFGKDNTIAVEYEDDMGIAGATYSESFVGDYYGQLFCDPEGNYYSNDLGEVLKTLDFGVLIAGQTSLIHEVVAKNKCGFDIKNVILNCPGILEHNVYVEMSPVETPFSAGTTMNLGTLLDTETRSFSVLS